MEKSYIYQKVRPRKSCFIVKDADLEGLKKVLKFISLSWGGFFCPILITDDKISLSQYNLDLIEKFDPDCIYFPSIDDKELLKKLDYLDLDIKILDDSQNIPHIPPIGILINSVFNNDEQVIPEDPIV